MEQDFEKKRDLVKKIFNGWIKKSIETTYTSLKSDHGGETTPLVAYLLVACAIDCASGFYAGRNPRDPKKIGIQYKNFVSRYMPQYDPDLLYKDLRCALAHNFSLGNLALSHNQSMPIHGKRDVDGRTAINFEDLFSDYEEAIAAYFTELDQDQQLRSRFLKRFDKGGIVQLTGANFSREELSSS